jgi:hypothetical protein
MKPVYNVEFNLTNRGSQFPNQTKEVVVQPTETIEQALTRTLNKYKRALNLSSNYSFTITSQNFTGYAK